MKIYAFNTANKIIVGYDVRDMNEARRDARNYNKRQRKEENKVAFLGNAREIKLCTVLTVLH